MKVVVFGGSGFLGSHVADRMSELGHEVCIFDIKESPYLQDSQRMIVGNILDTPQVRSAVGDSEAVYDFAGIADLDDASTKPIETVRFNVEGTCNIMDACVECGVKRLFLRVHFMQTAKKEASTDAASRQLNYT